MRSVLEVEKEEKHIIKYFFLGINANSKILWHPFSLILVRLYISQKSLRIRGIYALFSKQNFHKQRQAEIYKKLSKS